jgi:alginate O-acetyltransferase complex protein AlgJ
VRQFGDTMAMLDLPSGQRLFPRETAALRYVMGPDGDSWRPSRDADVLVLGDSFANIYSLPSMGWGESAGLVEQLSYALQRPIDRIVQNDQGAHATRAMLAREMTGGVDRLAAKRVVIWQFAARELAAGDWRLIALPAMTSRPPS